MHSFGGAKEQQREGDAGSVDLEANTVNRANGEDAADPEGPIAVVVDPDYAGEETVFPCLSGSNNGRDAVVDDKSVCTEACTVLLGQSPRGAPLDDLVEREDSEMLLTQAAIDAAPLPRKSFMVRRPSVVQFAELREAAAAVAQDSQAEKPALSPAPSSTAVPAPKSKFQVQDT